MELSAEFTEFLQRIRLTENQKDDLKTGHHTLRERLQNNGDLRTFIVTDFLQGSYRRGTAIKPKAGRRADVDIVVVTNLSEQSYAPQAAMDIFKPFLERYYEGKWRFQGRSIGIELSYVDLDLVITSAPSLQEITLFKSAAVMDDDNLEQVPDWMLNPSWLSLGERIERLDARQVMAKASTEGDWKLKPLRIPDRVAFKWQDTHPLEQLRWTRDKNKRTGGLFVNVVKALKWWRLANFEKPKDPKGFPLERLIGEVCPDAIGSIAEGVTLCLEAITDKYQSLARTNQKPMLPDYGVPEHDVFAKVSVADFSDFHSQVADAAGLAMRALESSDRKESGKLWRELFGNAFPEVEDAGTGAKSAYIPPSSLAKPNQGRFA